MKQAELEEILKREEVTEKMWEGKCHDCGTDTVVLASSIEGQMIAEGGAVYKPEADNDKVYLKCDSCFIKKPVLTGWRKTEVYSRVVGYLRPVDQWNDAKRNEFHSRKEFVIDRKKYDSTSDGTFKAA